MPIQTTRPPEIFTYDQFLKLTTPCGNFGRVRDLELLQIDRSLQTLEWAQNLKNQRMLRGSTQQVIDACFAWLNDWRKFFPAQYSIFDQPSLTLRDAAVHKLDGQARDLLAYYQGDIDRGVEQPKLPDSGGSDDVKMLVTSYKGLLVKATDDVPPPPVDTQGQLRLFAIDTRGSTMWMGFLAVQEILAQHNVLRLQANSDDGSADHWAPYFGTIKVTNGRVDLIQNGSRDSYLHSRGDLLWGAVRLVFEYGLDLSGATAVDNRAVKTTTAQDELKAGTEWFSTIYNAGQLALDSAACRPIRTTNWKSPGGPGDMIAKTGIA
jgi:hypothetical protein